MSSDKSRQKELARYSKKSKYTAEFGDIVFQQLIGTDTLRLYAKGYFSVGGVFKEPQPKKLVALNIDVQTAKKTGPGRLVAGVLTSGANLLLVGNVRGDIYVNVQSDSDIQSIHDRFPTNDLISELRRLEMLVATMTRPTQTVNSDVAGNTDKVEQLQELKSLFEQGLIDEAEFSAAKSKLLGLS